MANRSTRRQIIDSRAKIQSHLDSIMYQLMHICELAGDGSKLIDETIPSVVANIEILKKVIEKLWEGM